MSLERVWLGGHSEAPSPMLELALHDDQGTSERIEAMVDTGYEGELYLPHRFLARIRRDPEAFRKSWIELNPEPLAGLLTRCQVPAWQGTISFQQGQPQQIKVHEGRREHEGMARVGRAFLKRFEIVLLLDLERHEYELLTRKQD